MIRANIATLSMRLMAASFHHLNSRIVFAQAEELTRRTTSTQVSGLGVNQDRFPAKRAAKFADILPVVDTFDPLLTLKLSIQRALLGEVTDRLIAVTCGIHGKTVQIRVYFSGEVTPNDIERVSFLGGEVIADFPEPYKIEETTLSADDGEPEMLDFWAFIRAKQ